MMEKMRTSKFSKWADKLAVTAEPGLTNTQLMLANGTLSSMNAPALRIITNT